MGVERPEVSLLAPRHERRSVELVGGTLWHWIRRARLDRSSFCDGSGPRITSCEDAIASVRSLPRNCFELEGRGMEDLPRVAIDEIEPESGGGVAKTPEHA